MMAVKKIAINQTNRLASENQLSEAVIGAAIEVHKQLGPGLLESTYEECLAYELAVRNISVERQKNISLQYKEIVIECGFRVDFLVGDKLIVEIKAVEALLPVHQAQLITYLKLTGCKLGLLINFNVPLLKSGIKRIAL